MGLIIGILVLVFIDGQIGLPLVLWDRHPWLTSTKKVDSLRATTLLILKPYNQEIWTDMWQDIGPVPVGHHDFMTLTHWLMTSHLTFSIQLCVFLWLSASLHEYMLQALLPNDVIFEPIYKLQQIFVYSFRMSAVEELCTAIHNL